MNGVLYDVAFVDGSCEALYSGCDEASDLPFQNGTDALAAAQALLDQVFLDSSLGDFDTLFGLTNGCDAVTVSPLACFALFPFAVDGAGGMDVASAHNDASESGDVALNSQSFNTNLDFSNPSNGASARSTIAVWTLSATQPTPEAPTLVLLGLGLGGLWAARRRESRRDQGVRARSQ